MPQCRLAYTATEVLVPWLMLARAERSLPSSTTALLLAAVPLVGGLGPGMPTALPSPRVVLSVVVLGVICAALAFLLLGGLVRAVGSVWATTVVSVNPLVAVLAGALVLGERLTPWTAVGAALVLGGSALASAPPRRRPLHDAASAAA